jgi:hypothetical protein
MCRGPHPPPMDPPCLIRLPAAHLAYAHHFSLACLLSIEQRMRDPSPIRVGEQNHCLQRSSASLSIDNSHTERHAKLAAQGTAAASGGAVVTGGLVVLAGGVVSAAVVALAPVVVDGQVPVVVVVVVAVVVEAGWLGGK